MRKAERIAERERLRGRVSRVREWIDGGGGSWGVPLQDIAEICDRLEKLERLK